MACVVVAACQRSAATPPHDPPARRDAAAHDADLAQLDGPALFQHLCAPCHGADARGYKADHAPSLVNPTFLASASNEQLRRSIVFGRPGTSMAAYGTEAGGPLNPAEVARIVGWLRGQGPAPEDLPPVAPGDVARGAPIHMKNCATCHGTRTVRGDAVHLANPQFIAAASDAFLHYAIVHGRPGTKMEAWQGKLTEGEIDDVVAFVRAFAQPNVTEQLLPAPTGKEPVVLNPGGRPPAFHARKDPDRSYVPAAEVKDALAQHRRLVIIDARPESDWRRVHIPGAVSIPYLDMKRLAEIPKDGTWVITYCACPHHLSGIVADELTKRGYANVAVLDEGILEWHRRRYPVVAAPGVEPPPAEAVPGRQPSAPTAVGTPR